MTTEALALTLSFMGVALALSWWGRLGLERDLLIGTVRAAAQLLAVGYILKAVFDLRAWPFILAMLTVMVLIAGQNAAQKARGMPGAFWLVTGAIAAAAAAALAQLLLLRIVPFEPRFIIPLGGMVIGNAMVAAGLAVNRLQGEVDARWEQVEGALALGATWRQALEGPIKEAARAGMMPSVDTLKTVGIVQLPGMMTGQIIAGASPMVAVRYQILVMYLLAAAAALASGTVVLLAAGRVRPGRGRAPEPAGGPAVAEEMEQGAANGAPGGMDGEKQDS